MAERTKSPWSRTIAVARHIVADPRVPVGVAVIWTIVSVVACVKTHDWLWLQRAGSIITLAAAVLAGRAIVRLGREGAKPSSGMEIGTVQDSYRAPDGRLMVRMKRKPEAIAREREANKDAAAAAMALFMGVLGTLVWGYGDLVGLLFR